MEKTGKSEVIIQNVGCGPFQVIHFVSVFIVSYGSVAFTVHFMSFGNYNPGWRCLDEVLNGTLFHGNVDSGGNSFNNVTGWVGAALDEGRANVLNLNETAATKSSDNKYIIDDCPAYELCKNVEFNPAASTIVTEWGLLCDKAWIPSFIISLQMGGYLIGSVIAGVLGDAYGRKFVVYVSFVFTMIFNVISTFSTGWQMFAGLRFMLGLSMAFPSLLCYVYVAEFVPMTWRAIVLGLPYYPLTVVFFGVTCFIFKDWYHIQIAICVISATALIPALWLPESLRWLEVKNKTKEFEKTAQKIARYNRKPLLFQCEEDVIMNSEEKSEEKNEQTFKDLILNTFKLFGKEYRKYTLLTSIPWCAVSLLYFAIAFGVKALSGNFYLNLIIFYGIEVILDSMLMFAPNIFGRKKAGVAFCLFSSVCLLLAACFQILTSETIRVYAIASLVMFGRISISCFWSVLQLFMVEIYPTVARGAANSWGLFMTRVGGIIAPVLIPTGADTMFICYAVMGGLAIVCAVVVLLLPETLGKALPKSFNQNNNSDLCDDEKGTVV